MTFYECSSFVPKSNIKTEQPLFYENITLYVANMK